MKVKYGFGKKDHYVVAEKVDYRRRKCRPENLRKLHNPGILLYQLVTEGSHSLYDEGFLAGAEARDDD